jgi:hypothetical protein
MTEKMTLNTKSSLLLEKKISKKQRPIAVFTYSISLLLEKKISKKQRPIAVFYLTGVQMISNLIAL